MAKRKSSYSIEDQYASQGGQDTDDAASEAPSASDSALQLSADDVSQMQQLKAQGDQSGDYSQLGAYVAQLLGGSSSTSAAPSDDNLRESM